MARKKVVIPAREAPGDCPKCKVAFKVRRTKPRSGITLEHGPFTVNETFWACKRCGARRRSAELALLLPPGGRFGYDVIAFAGRQRFVHYRPRKEVQAEILEKFKIKISEAEVSYLEARFCSYLRHLHETRAPVIKAFFKRAGGYVILIDATGENGRGTVFLILEAWRKWVLGAWKIDTEQDKAILPKLKAIQLRFGTPLSLTRDMGKGNTKAAEQFAKKFKVLICVCHLHFLKIVGKDMMGKAHEALRKLMKAFKIKAKLRQLARKHGRKIGAEAMKTARKAVETWRDGDELKPLPPGLNGIAIVRAMAQWVLDYKHVASENEFPFKLPFLEFYNRAIDTHRYVEMQIARASTDDKAVMRALRSLHAALSPIAREAGFRTNAEILETSNRFFSRLRDILRLGSKPEPDTKSPKQQLEELERMRTAMASYKAYLKRKRPQSGPGKAKSTRRAIDLILKHLKTHGRNLWGHGVIMSDGTLRIIPRANVLIELLFGLEKRGERRRSGRKNLGHDLEEMKAEAFLALNLKDKEYVSLLCGEHRTLEAAFAALDHGHSSALPLRLKGQPTAEEDAETIGSSLPKEDRKIVRNERMALRMRARRRLPRRRPSKHHATMR